mgnify:CR=1 FL=1
MSVQSTSLSSSSSSSSSGNTSSSSSNTTITTDFDIFGVGDGINTSNYVYDGQTILLVNSSSSQSSSTVQGQYFDPVNNTKSAWYLGAQTNLPCSAASQALLNTNYNVMENIVPVGSSIPTYTIDLLNTGSTTTSSGNSGATTTMALLGNSNGYSTTNGLFNNTSPPTNTEPNYPTNSNCASYMFTGNYFFPQTSDIVIVYMIYTINGTDLLAATSGQTPGTPSLSVMVYNRVISKEALSRGESAGKLYTSGPITLSFMQAGATFSNNVASSNTTNYNVPVIIADNCQKIYATVSVAYVPYGGTGGGYYLNNGEATSDTPGLTISNNTISLDVDGIIDIKSTSLPETTSGHFVVGLTYANGSNIVPGMNVYCDLLIKNIWRSPVSIYNTYSSYSVSDMATKQVVILFGKSSSGATFLVTNSGTPINVITSYAVTSLNNFIGLMNSVISNYLPTSSLVSYFTDPATVEANDITNSSYTVAVKPQPLLSGSIINPESVTSSPNMWYMLLQTSNSANMSVDSTSQNLFNNDIGDYFDLQNSSLCGTGVINYATSKLTMLTANSNYLFANSIYSGQTTINNQTFYSLVILPEAQFNGAPTTDAGNISVYAVNNSPFYTSSSSSSKSSTRFDTSSSTSKIIMTVSNIDIV